jgi:hypothetical protein
MLAANGAVFIAMVEFLQRTRPDNSVRSTTSAPETLSEFDTLPISANPGSMGSRTAMVQCGKPATMLEVVQVYQSMEEQRNLRK